MFAKNLNMRLTDMLIEELVSNLAGPDTIELVRNLMYKENISEFILADELKLSVNQIRNMLYRLMNHNLVYSTRKKDRQKGWYIYYWTFNIKHARTLVTTNKRKRLHELKARLNEETQEGSFFICPDHQFIRMSIEEALENQYRCTECGKIMQEKESSSDISRIKQEIEKIEAQLNVKWEELPQEEEEIKVKKPRKINVKEVKKTHVKKHKPKKVINKIKVKKKKR